MSGNKANAAGSERFGERLESKSFYYRETGRQLPLAEIDGGGYPADMDDSHWQLAILDTPYVLGRRERAFG